MLDQVPRCSDPDQRLYLPSSSDAAEDGGSEPVVSAFLSFPDPLTGDDGGATGGGRDGATRFPVDHEINSRIYLWRGHPETSRLTPSSTPPTRAWTRRTVVLGCTPQLVQGSRRNAPPWLGAELVWQR